MEVWQIADSPFAPKFHVISQPNDWAKAVRKTAGQSSKVSEIRLLQLEFWEKFREFVRVKNSNTKLKKPYPQMWYDISFGYSGVHTTLTINSQTNQIGCEIYISNSKELFNALEERKEIIQQELAQQLVWFGLPGRKASRIRIFESGNISDTNEWEKFFEWMLNNVENFQRVFSKHISDINKKSRI